MAETTRNFLRQLKDPVDANLDIVAVHGLQPFSSESNAVSTWTASNGKMWLQDDEFLPSKLPRARILLFGYNSNPGFASSNAGLNDQAKNLLYLLRLRRDECKDRPVVFICHSLGGLLVKRALVIAFGNNTDKYLYEATHGLVFFGTPHWGAKKVSLGEIAASIARFVSGGKEKNSFLEALEKSSAFAESNRDDFTNRSRDFRFISFFESTKTSGHQVVKRESATLHLPDDIEDKIPLDADHSQMCKFSDSEADEFFPVWKGIKILCDDAVIRASAVQNEFFELYYPENENFQGQEAIISSVHEIFSSANQKQARCALRGFAGLGKSTIAIEYANRFRHEYNGVFWISAETEQTLKSDLHRIREQVALISKTSFKSWCEKPKCRWLLIIDNFEDPKIFDPAQHIPSTRNGHILITSRRTNLEGLGAIVVPVPPLRRQDAVRFLLGSSNGRRKTEDDESVAAELVEMLGFVPLAIQQCGAFVASEQASLDSYPKSVEELLGKIAPFDDTALEEDEFRWNRNSSRTILTTWELSFKQIENSDPGTAFLLCLLGFLDGSDVAISVLVDGFTPTIGWNVDGEPEMGYLGGDFLDTHEELCRLTDSGGAAIRRGLQKLISYSLIFEKKDKKSFYLHPLTHYWLSVREPSRKVYNIECAAFILMNGYPDLDLTPRYGLSETLTSQVKSYQLHLDRMRHQYLTLITPSRLTKSLLRGLFLQDASIKSSLGGPNNVLFESWPIYTYFDFVEQLLSDLGPCAHWIVAMTSYFDYHHLKSLENGKLLYTALDSYSFAGTTWWEMYCHFRYEGPSKQQTGKEEDVNVNEIESELSGIQLLENENSPESTAVRENTPESARDDGNTGENRPGRNSLPKRVRLMHSLQPIGLDPGSSSGGRALVSGLIGAFGVKMAQSWREMYGKPTYIQQPNALHIVIVDLKAEEIVQQWISKVIQPGYSSMERLVGAKLIDLCIQEKIDWLHRVAKAGDEAGVTLDEQTRTMFWSKINGTTGLLKSACEWISAAVGFESLVGGTIALRCLHRLRTLGAHSLIQELCLNHVTTSISSTNFALLAKVMQFRSLCFEDQEEWSQAELVLSEGLERFMAVPQTARGEWKYMNDPILNLLEVLIVYHTNSVCDPKTADEYKTKYLAYERSAYGTFLSRTCLGFDLGLFGTSCGRLPISLINTEQDDVGISCELPELEAVIKEWQPHFKIEEEREATMTLAEEKDACVERLSHFMRIMHNIDCNVKTMSLSAKERGNRLYKGTEFVKRTLKELCEEIADGPALAERLQEG